MKRYSREVALGGREMRRILWQITADHQGTPYRSSSLSSHKPKVGKLLLRLRGTENVLRLLSALIT